MTATRNVTLWCDHGHQPNDSNGCHEWTAGDADTVKEARATARLAGWRYVPGHPTAGPGRDFCPKHAADARATGA